MPENEHLFDPVVPQETDEAILPEPVDIQENVPRNAEADVKQQPLVPLKEVLKNIELPVKAEAGPSDSGVLFEITAAAAEQDTALEKYYERRAEVRDDPTAHPPGQAQTEEAVHPLPATPPPLPGFPLYIPDEPSRFEQVRRLIASQPQLYQQAVMAGFGTALLLVIIILLFTL